MAKLSRHLKHPDFSFSIWSGSKFLFAFLFLNSLLACSLDASIESTNAVVKPLVGAEAGPAVIAEETVTTTLGTAGYKAVGRLYDTTEKITTTLGTAGYKAEAYVQ